MQGPFLKLVMTTWCRRRHMSQVLTMASWRNDTSVYMVVEMYTMAHTNSGAPSQAARA